MGLLSQTIPPLVPPSLAPRTPPREGEVVADLSDLSADARLSSASFHALKRCRDAEAGDESSESLHGRASMKRSGSLRDLGMAPHMSGVPMTKSGLSGCLDDMGLSGLSDSPHERRAHQVHDLTAVPGSPATAPATAPMGEESPMMPKLDSVLSTEDNYLRATETEGLISSKLDSILDAEMPGDFAVPPSTLAGVGNATAV